MNKFSVGEIAIFIGEVTNSYEKINGKNGTGSECEIKQLHFDLEDGLGYWCCFLDDKCASHSYGWWLVQLKHLLKKKFPQEQLKTWEELKNDLGMGTEKVPVDAR